MPATKASGKPLLSRTEAIWIRVLTSVALVVSAYLLTVSIRGMGAVGCGSGSGCGALLASRWAYWLGLPVSIPGLALYGGLFAATFWLRPGVEPSKGRITRQLAISCAVCVIGGAAWFMVLQFKLRRFCPYCTAAHVCGLMASTILLCRVLRERKAGRAGAELRLRGPILGGLVAVVVLVTGQLVYRPVTQIIRPVAETKKTEASRELEILGGKFKIKLDEVPMSGPSNAPHVVVALLDYTCYGCRVLHAQLSAAQGIFTNQLGVVTLPVPLDGKCNPSVTEVFPAHTNGCEYARIGLALWRANRNASQQYEGWVFGPPEAPPVAQSRAVAERLVGAAEWQKALADPWVEEQLKQDVAIYEVTYARIRNHSMPQLLVGTNLIFGSFANMEDLLKVLGDQFGLRRAP